MTTGRTGANGAPKKAAAAPAAAAVTPVWAPADYDFVAECWDETRRASLYDLYFGAVVDRTQKTNFAVEIVIAITASGGAISSWTLWQDANWKWLWTLLVGIAAVISVIKPIARLDLRIERFSKLLAEYRALYLSYRSLIFEVQQAGRLEKVHRERQTKLAERMQHARQQWPARLDQARIEEFQKQVIKDMPADRLWAPPVPGKHPSHPLLPEPKPAGA